MLLLTPTLESIFFLKVEIVFDFNSIEALMSLTCAPCKIKFNTSFSRLERMLKGFVIVRVSIEYN
jgi:hypothetical protein